jgi:Arc/MetJ family transcription regulator
VHKTTLEVDEELFERVRHVLGTRGLKATVRRAFEEVLALDARRRAIRQLREMDGLDLDRPEVMAEAWR